jgi:tetratricopeptide (TPR) repeat protein
MGEPLPLAAPSSEKEFRRLAELEAKFERNSDDEKVFRELIQAYRKTGRVLAAAELLRKRCEKSPSDWEMLKDCVSLFVQANEPGRAAQVLNEFGSDFEDRWDFWDLRGRCLEGLGRHREALDEHRHASQMAPDEGEPRFRMGLAALELSDEDEALAHFQDALERDPHMGRALVNMGLLYERRGEIERALEMFRQAVNLEPENLEGHLNLGVLYAELGRSREAASEFLQATEIDARCADAHYNLGLLLEEVDPEQALQHLKKAITIDPAYREARFQVGRICYRRGLYPAAIKSLKWCLEVDPQDTGSLYFLALTYNKLDRPDETIHLLERLLELEPNHAQAHFYLGISYDKKGYYDKARTAYQRADELGREEGEGSTDTF